MANFSSTTQDMNLVRIRFALMKRYDDEFREANKERFESTSPYAVTNELPTLRVVDNAIQTGKGDPISIGTSSNVVRGFFGGVKGVINNTKGSGGGWKLDTKVQFDKVYMCSVTNREFTDEDMEKYMKGLRREGREYAENKVGEHITIITIPTTTNIIVRTDAGDEEFTQEEFYKFIGRGY